jgi:hypothetical protein
MMNLSKRVLGMVASLALCAFPASVQAQPVHHGAGGGASHHGGGGGAGHPGPGWGGHPGPGWGNHHGGAWGGHPGPGWGGGWNQGRGIPGGGYRPQRQFYYNSYYQPPQQGYVAGQRYQIPAGYEAYGPGTTISYGGANYVIGADGTMVASTGGAQGVFQPTAPQRYQIPAGYEVYGPGTTISYGGANYVIGADGTMSPN